MAAITPIAQSENTLYRALSHYHLKGLDYMATNSTLESIQRSAGNFAGGCPFGTFGEGL